ncbi:MAG: hypothetical protein H7X94_04825 [Vallitaleaceae bacterium]|nr:hypothetical protein [Vallitaleaceae bacterium]
MTGQSKLFYLGKLRSLSELSYNETKHFEVNAKNAIAKSLGKRTISVIEKSK